jgi:hypothetical protein
MMQSYAEYWTSEECHFFDLGHMTTCTTIITGFIGDTPETTALSTRLPKASHD